MKINIETTNIIKNYCDNPMPTTESKHWFSTVKKYMSGECFNEWIYEW